MRMDGRVIVNRTWLQRQGPKSTMAMPMPKPTAQFNPPGQGTLAKHVMRLPEICSVGRCAERKLPCALSSKEGAWDRRTEGNT